MYKIVITQRALRDIEELDEVTRKRIGEKIKFFSSDPLHYATKLINLQIVILIVSG